MSLRVLFLAANPDLDSLAIDAEVREVESKIRSAEHRDQIRFTSMWAVRPDDLLQTLMKEKPDIVHFSAYSALDEIMFVGSDGAPRPVAPKALAATFGRFSKTVRAVILSRSFSRPQAEAIAGEIDFVVGIPADAPADFARLFSAGFYRALAFGRSLGQAFELGEAAILLEGFDDGGGMPVLMSKHGVDAMKFFFSPKEGGEARVSNRSFSKSGGWDADAVDIWREKLTYLQVQEATVSDPSAKFTLRKQIQEAQAKLRELGD